MTPAPPSFIRSAATVFAVILSLQAIWIVTAELCRPNLSFFPISKSDNEAAIKSQAAAALGAIMGWPRGSLWVDDALASGAGTLSKVASGLNEKNVADEPIKTARRAAALDPADARIWLLLATFNTEAPKASAAVAQLKMSYYTSPFSAALFPVRIQIAARLPKLDAELIDFVDYEIGMIIRTRPDLKQSLVSAYRTGTADGRALIEAAIKENDPQLLPELHP